MSDLEETLAGLIRISRLPAPVREHRFAPPRRWRFDFAWPERMLAVECEGGTWAGGRHTRGSGFEGDCAKYNAAALLGWTVLRYTAGMLKRDAIEQIKQAMAGASPGRMQ